MVSRGRDSPASHRRSPTQQHEAFVCLVTHRMDGREVLELRLFNCEERYHSASIRAQLDPEAQLALCYRFLVPRHKGRIGPVVFAQVTDSLVGPVKLRLIGSVLAPPDG